MFSPTPLLPHRSATMVALAGLLVCLLLGYTVRPLHAEAAAPSADGLPGEWQRTPPGGGGAFATVGAGPTGIVLAASDLSGAYRSRDRGRTWDTIGAVDGLTATHIGSVGFDPQEGNILYLGTNTGIFRSANGGNTVTKVFTCPTTCDVSAIRFAPNNPQIGYAAYHPAWNSTQARIYKTTERGLTWSLTSASPPANLRVLKLLVHPTNPNTVYLLSGKARFGTGIKALYRSTNGGSTWTRLGTALGDVLDFTQDVSNPSVLYLTTYALFDTGQGWEDYTGSLYRSSDGGNNWSWRSDRTGALWLDRDDLKRVRIIDVARQQPWDARRGVWESADQGATWSQVSTADTWGLGWTNGWWVYHESMDGHAKTIGEDLSDPDALWWTNSRYVMATFDDGRRFDTQYTDKVSANGWQSRGFDNVVMFDVAIDAVNPNLVYAGYYDIGCWRSDDGAASWQNCNQPAYTYGEGTGGNSLTVETDPTRTGVVWQAQSGDIAASPDVLVRSSNGGQTWTRSDSGLSGETLSGLSVDRTSPTTQRILWVTAGGDVYRGANDGTTWTKRFDCNGCRYTATDRFNGNLVYAGGEAGLWRSTSGGATGSWQQIGLPEIAATGRDDFVRDWWAGVAAITPDPLNANWVYVAVYGAGKGIYRSQDGGVTWQKLWSNDFARNVAVSPANAQILYATSSNASCCGGYDPGSKGVMRSDDGGVTWRPINDGLDWPLVGAIAIVPSNPDLVYIGAQGNGVHKRNFANATPAANLVRNGEFSQGGANWSIWGSGVTYHTNNELCLYYAQPLPNFWDAGVDQSGLPLTQGKRYRLRVQLWSQQSATIKAIVGQGQAPWTNYWNQVISLPADQVKVYSYDFTMTNATDANSGLFFHVGGHSSPVLCIDKVELIPLGGITGVVRNSSSVALPNIRVTAYGWNGSAWRAVTSVNTNSTGRYLFNSLPPDQYRLRYYDPAARYRTEFYNNVSTLAAATNLAVSAGTTRNNINAVLAAVVLGASAPIAEATSVPTGRVIDAQSGAPVANAVVTLVQQPLAEGETSCPVQAATEGEWVDLQSANADTAGITPLLNPQQSDDAGGFGWRLTGDGCWSVTVAAEGYASVTTLPFQGENALQDLTIALPLAQKSYLPLATTSQTALATESEETESWSEEQMRPQPE